MKDKFEHKDGSFSVFNNTRKESPTHADMTGDGKFNGAEVWVNLWEKKDRNGKVYYSGSIRAKGAKPQSATPHQHNKPLHDDDEGSIPF